MNRKTIDIVPGILAWAKRNPERFFRREEANQDELIFWVLTDIFIAGGKVFIEHIEDWCLISSDVDWLETKSASLTELFTRVVSEPSRGDNSMRGEFLLGVFCTDVCVLKGGQSNLIKGFPFDFSVLHQGFGITKLAFRFSR